MKHTNFSPTTYIVRVVMLMLLIVLHALTGTSGVAQTRVALQPLARQVQQLETTLAYLGQPLTQRDHEAIQRAVADSGETSAVSRLQQILDKYVLAIVEINP